MSFNKAICIVSVACLIFLLGSANARRRPARREIANPDDCQIRPDPPPPGRICQKTCLVNNDCRSMKKSCKCDGDCGLSCIKHNQECNPLDAIAHGRVMIHPNNKFGAVAQYSCHEGYKLRGDQARVCQGDQTWSGAAPQCIVNHHIGKVECASPPDIPNAVHDGVYSPERQTFSLGTMLQYECLPEYALSRDAVVRAWCVGGGDWVGPTMSCDSILTTKPQPDTSKGGDAICSVLDDIENGWVTQDEASTPGSTATYHCQRGFHLAGRPEIVCEVNGEWNGIQPSCEKVTCRKPPVLENADHDGDQNQEMYPSGKQLMYTCAYGYHADGQPRAMCSGDGKWIGLTLLCSPQSCGFPGDIQDGWRTGYAFTYPSKVSYYCHDGFDLKGTSYRVCQPEGFWSDELPTCEPVTCPSLFAPHYGRMTESSNSYGTLIRFECDEGYKVTGSLERRCQADRTWSGSKTTCEEINCGWPGPFYNGYLIGHKTTAGAVMFYSCKTRASFEGKAFQSRCLETGEWSDPPPICWGQCQVPTIANATLFGGREQVYVNHGTEIQFECIGGLVARDGARMKCYNGTWSSIPECVPAPCPHQPPHVHNGLRVFMGRDHGFRAKYRCFAGYRLTGMNSTYLKCNFGKWEGGNPRCEQFFCPNPGTIAHGKIKKKVRKSTFNFQPYISSIRHGDKLVYDCNEGYRLDGPSGATCVNGEWQPPLSSSCIPSMHPPFRKMWQPIPNMND